MNCVFRQVKKIDIRVNEIIPNFSHATIKSKSLAEKTAKKSIVFDLSDVSTQFGLQLNIGRIGNGGKFNSISDDVTVGERVRIKLETIETVDFR